MGQGQMWKHFQPPDGYVPLREYARKHNIPSGLMYSRITQGSLKYVRVSGHLFIRADTDVQQFKQTKRHGFGWANGRIQKLEAQ